MPTLNADAQVSVDVKLFYRLENWQLDPNEPFVTLYVRKSGTFQRAIAKVAYRIAGGSEDRAAAAFAPPKSSIARNKIGQSDVRAQSLSAAL